MAMRTNVLSCSECGGSLKISRGQFLSKCNFCGTGYYVSGVSAPAILIKQGVDLERAKSTVLKNLRNTNVSQDFLKRSFFEKATLFYIPFIEIRGIKSRIIQSSGSDREVFGYTAYEYIERGSELSELNIDFIEMGQMEGSLLDAEQESFDLVKMRKTGVVLPVIESIIERNETEELSSDIIELHKRIIYMPVWEIKYSYRGIIFHSYISAVDGAVIEIRAIKEHKTKILTSITGLSLMGILFAKLLSMGLVYLTASNYGDRIASFMLLAILGGLIFATFIFFILFPFFWEMYAFREFVVIKGDRIESETINFEDNFFTKMMKSVTSGIGKILGSIKITIEDERDKT